MIIVALWPQIAPDWSDLSGSNFTECSWLSMPPSCCFLHALFYHHLVMYLQWRSQDITDARAQHGYTILVRNSEVQKHLEGCGACMLPQNIFGVLSPPTLLLRPHSCAVYVTIRQTRVWWAYVTRNSVAILRHSICRPLSARFTIDNGTISADDSGAYLRWWARPPVARARAPVCPSLATPLCTCSTYKF